MINKTLCTYVKLYRFVMYSEIKILNLDENLNDIFVIRGTCW
jgi:hypothetical protein